jgi:hypothetical protein
MITRYEQARRHFLDLCRHCGVPQPRITRHLPGDECDVTSADFVRLNVPATCQSPRHHAAHVFGHYLCNLEQTRHGDKVADLIAYWAERDTQTVR